MPQPNLSTRLPLTDQSVAALPLTTGGQRIVRDDRLAGFFVLVGTRTKSFMVQADLRGDGQRRSIRVKIGDSGALRAREARAMAKRLLGDIASGIDPRIKPTPEPPALDPSPPIRIIQSPPALAPRDPTLRQAWDSYRLSHLVRKGRTERTIESYQDHCERVFADWLETPLCVFGDDPGLVKARHDQLTEANGPYAANGAMRTFRAIYNHARKTAKHLAAENPVSSVDWNPEHRRDTGMGVLDLTAWYAQLGALENPIRREYQLFLLLSGSRPTAIKCARLEDLDLKHRLLFVPKPKGGEKRAFEIPLSREMVRCLVRVIRLGRAFHPEQARTWLFPANSKAGHLIEHKEERAELSKWGNELRQTYRTVAQVAGVNDVDMHLLMNHSVLNVNAGYITRHKLVVDHLRRQQQKISTAMNPPAFGVELAKRGPDVDGALDQANDRVGVTLPPANIGLRLAG